ncbi:putative reverse transcriptase domain-containing protein [Tanacetum coccineum]
MNRLDAAQKYERAFARYDSEDRHYRDDLEKTGMPISSDWANVRRLTKFLEHFYELTLKVSGTLYVTSNSFLDDITSIDAALNNCINGVPDTNLAAMAKIMKCKFDKYYGSLEKCNMATVVAFVLDPRNKFEYVEVLLGDVYGKIKGKAMCAMIKASFVELYEDYVRIHASPETHTIFESIDPSSSTNKRSAIATPVIELSVNKARGAKIHWGFLFGRVVVMSSASSAVTYTSVYTDSEPGRVFWGADDEEVSEGGIPRVIVLGYDGLPMQPVAPPSPDYIPGPEDPQTPPVPQDEDEREPMFIQAHDPDYVPEPIYPEYIPLEDEHEFPAEEQPLPPVDSPTAESPGYVTESDPEEDPEEYEDDETEDGPVDYPMDGGDDGDDDDGNSSRDDVNDEDEDDEDEEEEEEEHLAPADSAVVVPTDEPVSPPEGTEPVIPPPSTDITIGARITVRPQASISLPPGAEVERLLAMTTPSPSPPISLSPPSAGERLARCTAPPAHSSPPPVPSPLLPSSGCPTQIQTLRIASTQALIDAVTAALPSPSLPPLPPSLYIPPPINHRDDVPEMGPL